jgi:hypothetical protein
MAAGAVYSPPGLIAPVAALPPVVPSTAQVTEEFDNPVAVNNFVIEGATVADGGVIVKSTTLTLALPVIDPSAAVTVWLPACAGAM